VQTLLWDLFVADGLVISQAPHERYEKNVDLLGISVRKPRAGAYVALSVKSNPSVDESFISGA